MSMKLNILSGGSWGSVVKPPLGYIILLLILSGDLVYAGEALLTDTTFSYGRGFYTAPFEEVISTEMTEADIKYTLDGSDPRTSSNATIGSNPCTVTINPTDTNGRRATPAVILRACAFHRGEVISNVDTQTYIFLDDVIGQGEIKPSGNYVFWTTSMDPEVTRDPAYETIMHEALLSIPTMSVVMDWEDLFGVSGIHRGNNLARSDYEKPCSLELIYPDTPQFSGFKGFQVDCGIRIQGGGGRWDEGLYDHKQSFGIRFRREYGTGTLNYPVFESAPYHSDSEAGVYDKLVLRAGHNKSWGATWDNVHTVYTRDQFARDLQISMSEIGSRGTFVYLYLNGIYWGLYNPCERPDHAFSASYFGGSKEDYYSGKKKGGNVSGISYLFDYWRNTGSNTEDFLYLQQFIAVDEYVDMALLGVFGNCGDYPQYYFGNRNNPAGPIYFYHWDFEDAFGGGSRRSGNLNTDRLGACYEFDKMWSNNEEFRMRFADRAYKACFNEGVLTDGEVIKRWLRTCDYIYLAIVGESARWGDERFGDMGSRNWGGYQYHDLDAVYKRDNYWINARDAVTADLHDRAAMMIDKFRSRSYYPSINPPVFRHGSDTIEVVRKEVPAGYQLTIQHSGDSRTFYYTTDSSDPRGYGGAIQGINGGTSTTLTIDATTHVKARTMFQTKGNERQGIMPHNEWSALHEAMFFVDTDFNDLKITEIMYNSLPTRAATGIAIDRIIGNDIEGGNYDLALVELATTPPYAITEGDTLVIQGSSISGNNGEFTIHHVSGRDVILKEILNDEFNSDATGELLYDGDRYEFIELKNTGTEVINLSGIEFTNGIRFNFQDRTLLAPGEFKVIAAQAVSFAERYPDVQVDGEYFGKLSNGGEELEISFTTGELFYVSSIVGDERGYGKITLAALPSALRPEDRIQIKHANNASNNGIYKIASIQGNQVFVTSSLTDEEQGAVGLFFKVLAATEYDDKDPWPLEPDGLGYSLVSAEGNPVGNPGNNAYWRTSTHIHGSPGQDDPEPSYKPIITLSVRQLTTSISRNTNASPLQFDVWNRGQDALNYEITDNADWLSVSPVDGNLNGGALDRNTHDVTFETDNLTGGIHEAMVTVSDPRALNSPQTINVCLEVLTPEIVLSTENLSSRVSQGGNAPEQTFNVWNSGIGTLNYSVVTNENWLSVFPDSGSSVDYQTRQSHTVAFYSDGMALGEYHATIIITDSDAKNNPRTISVTLIISEEGSFVAYNDLNSTNSINAPNVTEYDYSATNERLKDVTTGEDLFITVTGSVSPDGAYDPYGSNGGNFTNLNSDAYEVFNGSVDLTGVFELDAPDWKHVLTFNNLEPDKKYTISLTANRDNSNYRDQRFSKVTIEGAESYRNVSSAGVIVHSEASISFSTGYNTINGYVAKWTDISLGPDGSFSIVSAWDDNYPGTKGYAMSGFRLESDN